MDEKYIHKHHSLYHIILCPGRRRKVLVGPVHTRLQQLIEEVAQEQGWEIVELAIQPDHVHLAHSSQSIHHAYRYRMINQRPFFA